MTMPQKTIDTKTFSLGPEMKLKKMGLLRLYWEMHLGRKQTKELQATDLALAKNLAALNNTTDFSLVLNYLDEREVLINNSKELFHQMQERARRIYQEITRERQQDDIMIASRIDDALDDVFVMRILLKIAQERNDPFSFLNKFGDLFTWLELRGPAVVLHRSEKVIAQQTWQVITIEDSQCRYWDDMPGHIRRRHSKFKQMFESVDCKVYYDTSPSSGTTITIEIPPEIVEGKFLLTDKIFKSLDNPFLGILGGTDGNYM